MTTKRPLCTAAAVLLCLVLTGCGVSRDYRPLEQLVPVRTLALDCDDRSVTAAVLLSGSLTDDTPRALCQSGTDIENALLLLQQSAPDGELYYAHVQNVLVGTPAAEGGLYPWLEWFARNPDMRLDTALYIVWQDKASALVTNAAENDVALTARLELLEQDTSGSAAARVTTVRDVLSALWQRGAAYCCTLGFPGSDGSPHPAGEDEVCPAPVGYAILKDGALAGFLTGDAARAVALLDGDPGTGRISLPDGSAVMLDGGSAHIEGIWAADGSLTGADIAVMLEAGLLTAGDADEVQALLTEAALGWLTEALESCRTLGCDWLGLQEYIARSAPEKALRCGAVWPDILQTLTFRIRVDAQMERGYDLHE